MGLVHSAPLSVAVTGKVYTNKDISFVSRKKMKASVKIRYDLAFINKGYFKNKHNKSRYLLDMTQTVGPSKIHLDLFCFRQNLIIFYQRSRKSFTNKEVAEKC